MTESEWIVECTLEDIELQELSFKDFFEMIVIYIAWCVQGPSVPVKTKSARSLNLQIRRQPRH